MSHMHFLLSVVIPGLTNDGGAHVPGPATGGLVTVVGAILLFCLLSGKWWIAGYMLFFVLAVAVATFYAFLLEYNSSVEMDRRREANFRAKPRSEVWRGGAGAHIRRSSAT